MAEPVATQKITNPYGTNNWGFSLDVSGNHAIVGDNGLGTGVLFRLSGGTWSELIKLTYTGNIGSSQWGRTVSIWEVSDTEVWIVVAGRGQDSPGTNAGAVWLYKWNGSTCVQQSNSPFQGSDTIAGDNFGSALAITVDSAGNGWIVVGAHEHTGGKGKGYLFKFPTSGGSEGVVAETDDFVPAEASAGAGVGQHEGAAIQADYSAPGQHQLAVGGYLHEDEQPQQGGIWVYTFGASGTVTPAKYITEGISGDHVGYSIAFGNGFLVTNARIIAPSSYNGARIYRGGGGTWDLEDSVWSTVTDTTGDTFTGASINAIVIGQASWDLPASGSGAAAAWKLEGGVWTEVYEDLQPDDTAGLDYFGCAVAITDQYILAGQYGDDDAGSGDGAWYSLSCPEILASPNFTVDEEDQYDIPPYGGDTAPPDGGWSPPEDEPPSAGYGSTHDPLLGGEELCGEIEDHRARALALLPGQFENSTALQDLIGAFIGPPGYGSWGVQQLECVLTALHDNRWPATASGQQLDELGEIVGLARRGLSDACYLLLILLQIQINSSKSNPERIITAAKGLTGADLIHYQERPPSRVVVYCHGITCPLDYLAKLDQTAGAGIAVTVTGTTVKHPFRFGVDRDAAGAGHGSVLPYGAGFGETTLGGVGGNFTEVYT
jgi:hypothetical protein